MGVCLQVIGCKSLTNSSKYEGTSLGTTQQRVNEKNSRFLISVFLFPRGKRAMKQDEGKR